MIKVAGELVEVFVFEIINVEKGWPLNAGKPAAVRFCQDACDVVATTPGP